jgi:pyruvate/2-oxoglutarate dehydrogenase complex dihydrolipoamide acyltransferase (E2) component
MARRVQVPAVAGDEVVVRPILTMTATFDHRYVDGFHAARFAAAVRSYCESPARFEPALPAAGQASSEPATL